MDRRVAGLTALAPMTWGTTYVVTSELLPDGRPLTASVLRALPVGLALVATNRSLPHGAWWWRSFVLGALNFAVFFSLLFTAAYRLPGGVAATVGALQPLVVMALGVVVLRERTNRPRIVAGVLGVIGVGLLVLDGGARMDPVGVVAAIGAAASMATGSVLVQRWGRPTSATAFAGWQLSAGGLLLVPVALSVEGVPHALTSSNVAGYAYLAVIGGGLAYTLWFRGIDRLGAGNATFLSLLSPLVATTITLVRGEPMSPVQLLGAAAVVGSVAIAQRTPTVREPIPAEPLGRVELACAS